MKRKKKIKINDSFENVNWRFQRNAILFSASYIFFFIASPAAVFFFESILVNAKYLRSRLANSKAVPLNSYVCHNIFLPTTIFKFVNKNLLLTKWAMEINDTIFLHGDEKNLKVKHLKKWMVTWKVIQH